MKNNFKMANLKNTYWEGYLLTEKNIGLLNIPLVMHDYTIIETIDIFTRSLLPKKLSVELLSSKKRQEEFWKVKRSIYFTWMNSRQILSWAELITKAIVMSCSSISTIKISRPVKVVWRLPYNTYWLI